MQILGSSYSYQSGTDNSNFRPQYDPPIQVISAAVG